MTRTRVYGWRRTPDHLRPPTADHSGLSIAKEVDPRDQMLDPFNQWALGACTIHADIGAFTYDQIVDGITPVMLCRFQGYWLERQKEGSLGQGDTGAIGSDGFRAAAKRGLVAETAWPYAWPGQAQDEAPASSVFDPPTLPPAVLGAETVYKLTKPYKSVTPTKEAMQAVLSNRQTIAFGFTVYESFESAQVAKTGIVPMPEKGEKVLGGHEPLLVGYLSDYPDHGLVRNSWGCKKTGSPWGLDGSGYFLMPWSYLTNKRFCGDWTTIVRATK